MSLAKVVSVNAARKDWGACPRCGDAIRRGDPYRYFAVGFRGSKQVRCNKVGCYPTPSQRESSIVADVYAAQESALDSLRIAGSLEEIQAALMEIGEACDQVASQYEENPTFEGNDDLQQRVDTLRAAEGELNGWDPDEDEPTEEDEESWTEFGDDFQAAYEVRLSGAKGEAERLINEVELP